MRYPLPYAFARTQQLLLEDDAGIRTLWLHAASPASAVSEVVRKHAPQAMQTLDAAALVQRISAAYSRGESNAATVVHEVESDADLSRMMQDLPAALISRLKIMAELDIAEKRLPQDGRISLRLGTRAIDVRVSTLPSAHGERAVLRLLDKSESRLSLESLGMQGDTLSRLEHLVEQPYGIILVTGPTGSGKTTTLYAALQKLDAGHSNIMTVEDPIEYELPGVGQTQVNSRIDLTFAKALRAILRQDPDVIMIGEIRDFETAQIAIQASLTGHLVLATLHTNTATSAVTRLIDMGIEPFLLSSSLLGVLAQRLVRKLCPHCKKEDAPGRWRAVGCAHCAVSGYKGRTGIYELMTVDDAVRDHIHNRAPESELLISAQAAGLRTMREDGERLVNTGVTTAQELVRVTRD